MFFFFFNDTATTEIYTLSLHDALPIYSYASGPLSPPLAAVRGCGIRFVEGVCTVSFALDLSHNVERSRRSEEHTSELQSLAYLVCRLLLEKKNNQRHVAACHMVFE